MNKTSKTSNSQICQKYLLTSIDNAKATENKLFFFFKQDLE